MKEARKTANLIIRETNNKKNPKQELKIDKAKTSTTNHNIKKWYNKNDHIQLQKQLMKAENLTQEEQKIIAKQATKMVTKKVKISEKRIENEMISFLELQCSKLGEDIEKQREDNSNLRIQITQLRKKIQILNQKLENIYKNHNSVKKSKDQGQVEKQHLRQQIKKLKVDLIKQINYKKNQQNYKSQEIQILKNKLEQLQLQNKQLLLNLQNITEEKEELQEGLEQKTSQCQLIKDYFEKGKKQWDKQRQVYELSLKETVSKKGEKITKFQAQNQNLNDKLKQQQTIRKKLTEKNKQLEKQLQNRSESVKNLQQQIISLKKRVNDLSILKSSNNTIMNQKITKLGEQNNSLKKKLEEIMGKKSFTSEVSKPYLFGPDESN